MFLVWIVVSILTVQRHQTVNEIYLFEIIFHHLICLSRLAILEEVTSCAVFFLTLLTARFSFPHFLSFFNLLIWRNGLDWWNRRIFNGPFFLSRTSRSSPGTILLPRVWSSHSSLSVSLLYPNKCVFFYCSLFSFITVKALISPYA